MMSDKFRRSRVGLKVCIARKMCVTKIRIIRILDCSLSKGQKTWNLYLIVLSINKVEITSFKQNSNFEAKKFLRKSVMIAF